MDQGELARLFNDSYDRAMKRSAPSGAEFFSAFYSLLMAKSPEAAHKFRHVDMREQVRMLRASLATLLAFFATGGQDDYLGKLAERHSKRGADIPPELYSVWLDCLLETAGRCDPDFSDEVEAAWRSVFSKGIEFMISRYGES